MSELTMPQVAKERPKSVIGPDGKLLTLDDLPPPNTQRWVARRKAEVVAAVRAGLLSLEDACRRYHLSTEEFMAWQGGDRQAWSGRAAGDPDPGLSLTRGRVAAARNHARNRRR
jgi:hypothetical protein